MQPEVYAAENPMVVRWPAEAICARVDPHALDLGSSSMFGQEPGANLRLLRDLRVNRNLSPANPDPRGGRNHVLNLESVGPVTPVRSTIPSASAESKPSKQTS